MGVLVLQHACRAEYLCKGLLNRTGGNEEETSKSPQATLSATRVFHFHVPGARVTANMRAVRDRVWSRSIALHRSECGSTLRKPCAGYTNPPTRLCVREGGAISAIINTNTPLRSLILASGLLSARGERAITGQMGAICAMVRRRGTACASLRRAMSDPWLYGAARAGS